MIGLADGQGRRPVYFVTGDGMLHIINAADGTDLQPPYKFYAARAGRSIWWAIRCGADTYGGASIAAVRVDDPETRS